MSKQEAQKILLDFGMIYNTKNNMSQLGGIKVLLELLNRGKYRDRLTELFGPYKARTILQMTLGLWAGARTMLEVGQTGKDPLVKRYIGDVVEEAKAAGVDQAPFVRTE